MELLGHKEVIQYFLPLPPLAVAAAETKDRQQAAPKPQNPTEIRQKF